MNKNERHNSDHHSPIDDRELEMRLRAIESGSASADPAIEAMRRDRDVLRAALLEDLSEAIPAGRRAQFAQAVSDEIDRRLLAGLSEGTPVDFRPPALLNVPKQRAPRAYTWKRTHSLALAAAVAIVCGVAWLAMQRPGTSAPPIASGPNGEPRKLPSWAILPDRAPQTPPADLAKSPPAIAQVDAAESDNKIEFTRDASTALGWARKGVLAIRITTDSPGRDRERLVAVSQRNPRTVRWALSASAPTGVGVIPTHPWPIDARLADSNDSATPLTKRPESASIATFGLTVRPTVEVLDAVRNDLEQIIAGVVIFERVDRLADFTEGPQAEPAPDTAMDVIWWKKPASQWSPRLRVPVLLEFGRLERDPSASTPAK